MGGGEKMDNSRGPARIQKKRALRVIFGAQLTELTQ